MPVTRLTACGLAAWAVTLLTCLALRATFSTDVLSGAEMAGWLFLAGVPAAVVLMVLRRTPPTIAYVPYEAAHPRRRATPQSDRHVGR